MRRAGAALLLALVAMATGGGHRAETGVHGAHEAGRATSRLDDGEMKEEKPEGEKKGWYGKGSCLEGTCDAHCHPYPSCKRGGEHENRDRTNRGDDRGAEATSHKKESAPEVGGQRGRDQRTRDGRSGDEEARGARRAEAGDVRERRRRSASCARRGGATDDGERASDTGRQPRRKEETGADGRGERWAGSERLEEALAADGVCSTRHNRTTGRGDMRTAEDGGAPGGGAGCLRRSAPNVTHGHSTHEGCARAVGPCTRTPPARIRNSGVASRGATTGRRVDEPPCRVQHEIRHVRKLINNANTNVKCAREVKGQTFGQGEGGREARRRGTREGWAGNGGGKGSARVGCPDELNSTLLTTAGIRIVTGYAMHAGQPPRVESTQGSEWAARRGRPGRREKRGEGSEEERGPKRGGGRERREEAEHTKGTEMGARLATPRSRVGYEWGGVGRRGAPTHPVSPDKRAGERDKQGARENMLNKEADDKSVSDGQGIPDTKEGTWKDKMASALVNVDEPVAMEHDGTEAAAPCTKIQKRGEKTFGGTEDDEGRKQAQLVHTAGVAELEVQQASGARKVVAMIMSHEHIPMESEMLYTAFYRAIGKAVGAAAGREPKDSAYIDWLVDKLVSENRPYDKASGEGGKSMAEIEEALAMGGDKGMSVAYAQIAAKGGGTAMVVEVSAMQWVLEAIEGLDITLGGVKTKVRSQSGAQVEATENVLGAMNAARGVAWQVRDRGVSSIKETVTVRTVSLGTMSLDSLNKMVVAVEGFCGATAYRAFYQEVRDAATGDIKAGAYNGNMVIQVGERTVSAEPRERRQGQGGREAGGRVGVGRLADDACARATGRLRAARAAQDGGAVLQRQHDGGEVPVHALGDRGRAGGVPAHDEPLEVRRVLQLRRSGGAATGGRAGHRPAALPPPRARREHPQGDVPDEGEERRRAAEEAAGLRPAGGAREAAAAGGGEARAGAAAAQVREPGGGVGGRGHGRPRRERPQDAGGVQVQAVQRLDQRQRQGGVQGGVRVAQAGVQVAAVRGQHRGVPRRAGGRSRLPRRTPGRRVRPAGGRARRAEIHRRAGRGERRGGGEPDDLDGDDAGNGGGTGNGERRSGGGAEARRPRERRDDGEASQRDQSCRGDKRECREDGRTKSGGEARHIHVHNVTRGKKTKERGTNNAGKKEQLKQTSRFIKIGEPARRANAPMGAREEGEDTHTTRGRRETTVDAGQRPGPEEARRAEKREKAEKATQARAEAEAKRATRPKTLGVAEAPPAKRKAAVDAFWAETRGLKRDSDGRAVGKGEKTARKRCRELGVDRVCAAGQEGIVSLDRLEWAADRWRKTQGSHKAKGAKPPESKIRGRMSTEGQVLKTATAGEGAAYYEPGHGTFMSATRLAALFVGEGHAITQAVGRMARQESDVTERKAARKGGARGADMPRKKVAEARLRSMMGGAMHAPTGELAAKCMMEGMGWQVGDTLRWADMASGVGTTAAAVQAAAGGKFTYVVAAERSKDTARVLEEAWGVENVGEATTAEWRKWARRADAVGLTQDCGRFSKRARKSKERTDEGVEAGLDELRRMAEGAEMMKTRAVMVESVGDLLDGENEEVGRRLEEVLRRAMPTMEWRAQVLDAHMHGAAAMARRRAFWVGVRGGWAAGGGGGEGSRGGEKKTGK